MNLPLYKIADEYLALAKALADSEWLCSREVLISPQRLDFMTNPN
jgi:hypothetical protein